MGFGVLFVFVLPVFVAGLLLLLGAVVSGTSVASVVSRASVVSGTVVASVVCLCSLGGNPSKVERPA